MQKHAQKNITGDGPLLPMMIRLAAPVVLMMYMQSAYNIIDTIWVGQLLGNFALAGVGSGGYVLWGLFGFSHLVAAGLTATVSRRIGEGNHEEANRTATKGIYYSLSVSLVVAALTWYVTPYIFEMMGTDHKVTADGVMYLQVLTLGIPFIFLSMANQSIFQASGDTITPMWLLAASLVINAVLDPMMMIGIGPFPAMGTGGAALATVFSRLLVVLGGLILLHRGKRLGRNHELPIIGKVLPKFRDGYIRICFAEVRNWDMALFRRIVRIGAPTAVSTMLFPFVYMVLVRIIAPFGANQVAALKIGHSCEGLSFFLALGFSIATSTAVGQNLGAGKPERAKKAGWASAVVIGAVLFVFSICFYVFDTQVASLFIDNAATVSAGAKYLRIVAWSQIFMGMEIIFGAVFTGAGDTTPPMLINVPLNLARIPAAYVLANTFGWGVAGVWWAISASSIVKGVIMGVLFHTERWKMKEV